MKSTRLVSLLASSLFALAGCGGGSSGGSNNPPPPPTVPVSQAEAFQFLNQATFGATEAAAQTVINMGFEAWIDSQLQQSTSLQLPHLQSLPRPQFLFELQPDRADIWFRNALHGDDQLRQRVAFALSEIMVVSQLGALGDLTYSLGDYYDVLSRNAFGNYRDLMEEATLHPAMGVYLSMLGNEKPDAANNIRPDENYARELMQLFSIGLVQLNNDATIVMDGQGQPLPTYDQAIIEGFAHVFTGWTFAGAFDFRNAFPNDANQVVPMQVWPAFHDNGAKTLLDGFVVPAGQSGADDLRDALDNIFNHSNVGPFISTRLIQRLVTSNPSPAYVSRIASVFNDNGSGVRGDLGAVVKAILLDSEARPASPTQIDGKVKEPLLRLTQFWRSYDAASASGGYPINYAYIVLGQGALQSPSVFNFFSPFYAPPGEIRNNNLVAPELGIATEYLSTFITNYMFYQTFLWNHATDPLAEGITEDTVLINYAEEVAIAGDANALVDRVAGKLLAGQISDALRTEVLGMLDRIPVDQTLLRAAETIYLVVTSPEFAYQR
jgi:uncharacterized protein (DUF1800 family)